MQFLYIGTDIGIFSDLVFDAPSQMEPMLSSPGSEELEEPALNVARRSTALGGSLRKRSGDQSYACCGR